MAVRAPSRGPVARQTNLLQKGLAYGVAGTNAVMHPAIEEAHQCSDEEQQVDSGAEEEEYAGEEEASGAGREEVEDVTRYF